VGEGQNEPGCASAPLAVYCQRTLHFRQPFHQETGSCIRLRCKVIHPEEILAENFAMLVMGDQGLPSPEVVQKMERLLSP